MTENDNFQASDLFECIEIGKASSGEVTFSRALSEAKEKNALFNTKGAIAPPFPPFALCRLYEVSNALRQNIDAYETNIDAAGHRFVPTFDFDDLDAKENLRDLFLVEDIEMTDEQLDKKFEELRKESKIEKLKIKNFFDFCSTEESFISLRRKLRRDNETVGWGAWEILRDKEGNIAQFVHIPSCFVRLMPQSEKFLKLDMKVKKNPIEFREVTVHKKFRRFIQIDEVSNFVYFKEYSDPRVMSSETGDFFTDQAELNDKEGIKNQDGVKEAIAATEILYMPLSNFSIDSPYGKPRWIGNLLSILGSRESEEVNFLYFQNKSVPPLAILVNGGKIGSSSVKRIEDFVENNLRGKRNFHKILIIEATPFGKDESAGVQHSGKAKIEIKNLTDAQLSDALFQNYDEKNRDKVGESFRLPRLLRGDVRDFNKSTAVASLIFAESQVFHPERDLFDSEMNRKILTDMGIKFWEFRSMGPITKDSDALSLQIERMVKVGVITPEEARVFAEDVFNRVLKKIDSPWVKQPIALTLAGFGLQMAENGEMGSLPGEDNRLRDKEEMLQNLANKMAEQMIDKMASLVKGNGDVSTESLDNGGKLLPTQEKKPKKKPKKASLTDVSDDKLAEQVKKEMAGHLGVSLDSISESQTDEGLVLTVVVSDGCMKELVDNDD